MVALPAEALQYTEYKQRASQSVLDWYSYTLQQPLTLISNQGPVTYYSDSNRVDERVHCLGEYLAGERNTADAIFGRNLFGEIASKLFIDQQIGPYLQSVGLDLVASPTSLDSSINACRDHLPTSLRILPQEPLPYQKGTDLCLVGYDENREAAVPIIGIDLTMGDGHIVRKKRNVPGIQTLTGMGVVVLPLRRMLWGPNNSYAFGYLLDSLAHNPGLIFKPDSFPMVPQSKKKEWMLLITNALHDGVQACRGSIESSQDSRVTSYGYLTEVLNKLHLTEELLGEIKQYVAHD